VDAAGRNAQTGHALQVLAAMLVTADRRVAASQTSAARIYGLDFRHEPLADVVTLTRPPGRATGRRRLTTFEAAQHYS
jgi:hypothetical protein